MGDRTMANGIGCERKSCLRNMDSYPIPWLRSGAWFRSRLHNLFTLRGPFLRKENNCLADSILLAILEKIIGRTVMTCLRTLLPATSKPIR